MTLPALPPPIGGADPATAGQMAAGTYQYVVSFLTPYGESTPSTPISVSLDADHSAVSLTGIPLGPDGTTGRNLYRSHPGGSFPDVFFIGNLPDNLTEATTDGLPDSALGAPPAINFVTGE